MAELYEKKLKLFCRMSAKDGPRRVLVVDDVDLYSISIQTQLYAVIQRHRADIHILISYTHASRVIPELAGQCIPVYLSDRGLPPSDVVQSIQSSLTYIQKPSVHRAKQLAQAWISLHQQGVLISDIVAFIGESILHSKVFTDEQIFHLYACYKKWVLPQEHVFVFYLLADALCNL
jgi:hypothetical protein